jgi:hypothetical protein
VKRNLKAACGERVRCSSRVDWSLQRRAAHRGEAKLTDLLVTLANCAKARSLSDFHYQSALAIGSSLAPGLRSGAFESVASIAADASAVTEIATIQPLL